MDDALHWNSEIRPDLPPNCLLSSNLVSVFFHFPQRVTHVYDRHFDRYIAAPNHNYSVARPNDRVSLDMLTFIVNEIPHRIYDDERGLTNDGLLLVVA
ncbi:hypothetical protein N7475_004543 [Penicillium sp. IBT 31633x]|nr:hypothetical protein N7475_004543 [Penicillium sp. IBT 31633x]